MAKPSNHIPVRVMSISAAATVGWLVCGHLKFRCALGRSGRRALKREGDGATPIGRWPIRRVFYRSDRISRPATPIPVRTLAKKDGWCDEPSDPNYNRLIRHPYPASAEEMWREDGLYDVVVVLGHNERPRIRRGGSAIFMHVARPDWKPTAGCVALERSALLKVLRAIDRRSRVVIPA